MNNALFELLDEFQAFVREIIESDRTALFAQAYNTGLDAIKTYYKSILTDKNDEILTLICIVNLTGTISHEDFVEWAAYAKADHPNTVRSYITILVKLYNKCCSRLTYSLLEDHIDPTKFDYNELFAKQPNCELDSMYYDSVHNWTGTGHCAQMLIFRIIRAKWPVYNGVILNLLQIQDVIDKSATDGYADLIPNAVLLQKIPIPEEYTDMWLSLCLCTMGRVVDLAIVHKRIDALLNLTDFEPLELTYWSDEIHKILATIRRYSGITTAILFDSDRKKAQAICDAAKEIITIITPLTHESP